MFILDIIVGLFALASLFVIFTIVFTFINTILEDPPVSALLAIFIPIGAYLLGHWILS